MIKRAYRFHGYGSLKFIYRHGDTIRGPLCSLKYIKNTRRDKYRLSIVVNRKVNRSAVVRNKIRRKFYEVVRLLQDQISDPYDLVFTIFSDQILELSPQDLTKLVKAQLKQAGVIQSKHKNPPVLS